MTAEIPELSVVLASTKLEAVRQALDCFRHQTAAARVEVVLVAPRAELERLDPRSVPEFGALRCVESDSPFRLMAARAKGVLESRARWVFIGETHSFADPTMIAALLAAIGESSAPERAQAFVPCIYNVNPTGVVSWASLLIDYGAWGPGHAAGEPLSPPIYNGVFERAMLTELGDGLVQALSPHDDSVMPLRAGSGDHALFIPAARIGHLNVVRFGDFVRSKAQCGLAVADARARRWSWGRRIAYAAASPLIGVVLFERYLRHYGVTRHVERLPFGTLPLLLVGALVRAVGEAVGYLGWSPATVHARIEHLEIFKAEYVPGWNE